MKLGPFTTFFCLVCLTAGVDSANILMVMYFGSKSHKNVFDSLADGLVARDHQVTMMTCIPKSRDVAGLHEVNPKQVLSTLPIVLKRFETPDFPTKYDIIKGLLDATMEMCEVFLKSPEMQEVMKSKFDFILIDGLQNDCAVGMAYRMQVPFGYLHTGTFIAWHSIPTRLPLPSSIVPSIFNVFSRDMTFCQRLYNFLLTNGADAMRNFYAFPKEDKLMKRYLGEDIPSMEDMERNISLIMSNQHFSFELPRAWLPGLIEVGGIHCKASQTLPDSLLEFVESSSGFIYFSFGSVIKGSDMDPKIRDAYLNVFSKLKERVLWKWETETMEGVDVPKNVKLSKWLPQQDILGHPKCRLFITHGGLLGQQEAIYHGVPMLVLPFFGDQHANAARAVLDGYALQLDMANVAVDQLHHAISRLLTEPQFRQRVTELSRIFKDQPETPLNRAIFWTEYVIRHKGAAHMRSSARNMPLYQVYLIDVLAFIAIAITMVFATLYFVLQKLFKWVCGTGKQKRE